ncbi:MAG: bifunctional oligoribonuclease/PAP phosphatase NrnA [Caldilineales bacterium]|nr:bifunctional oligoribonuclease/PAP phosphatase NrnA [Caldilineales bacterium]
MTNAKNSIAPLKPPPSLLEAIQSARHPALIAHIAPDGDAIGSLLGLGILLYELGKDPILACQDRVPISFQFLPFADQITDQIHHDADLIIALDSSDRERLGDIYHPGEIGNLPLVVIDHHITNLEYGGINWIEPGASATAEMIYYLAEALHVPVDTAAATCLLTGIVTDTRGFRTNNTTSRTMHVVAKLTAAGASLNQITETTLNSNSSDLIRLWGRALVTMQIDGGVISAVNKLAMREDLGRLIRADGLASFLLSAREAQIAVVFTELPDGEIEISFRARPGQDVASLALELGGGGHPLASGCTVNGTVEDVRRDVVKRLLTAA